MTSQFSPEETSVDNKIEQDGYDTSDFRNGVKYGCYVDISEGETPDRCVIDVDHPSSCDFGILPSGRERKSKWTCPHWKRLMDKATA